MVSSENSEVQSCGGGTVARNSFTIIVNGLPKDATDEELVQLDRDLREAGAREGFDAMPILCRASLSHHVCVMLVGQGSISAQCMNAVTRAVLRNFPRLPVITEVVYTRRSDT